MEGVQDVNSILKFGDVENPVLVFAGRGADPDFVNPGTNIRHGFKVTRYSPLLQVVYGVACILFGGFREAADVIKAFSPEDGPVSTKLS